MPTLVIHGTGDTVIDIERARESRETIRRFEVGLTYREFEMEHEIRPEALTLVGDWLVRRAFGGADE